MKTFAEEDAVRYFGSSFLRYVAEVDDFVLHLLVLKAGGLGAVAVACL